MKRPPRSQGGPGRILIAIYAVFALAASARAGVQIATRLSQAPLAYGLSAVAAVVYIGATLALSRGWLRVARVACRIELVGVLVVGAASIFAPERFPAATVWSQFGRGYGFIPLVLPIAGLVFLARLPTGRSDAGP
jgi:hypothetical protein